MLNIFKQNFMVFQQRENDQQIRYRPFGFNPEISSTFDKLNEIE